MAVNISDERFDAAPLGSLITWGLIENSPDGVYMVDEKLQLLWGMWKGRGTDDWCIYVSDWVKIEGTFSWKEALEYCHNHGDKVLSHSQISKMVNVSERLYDKYRR